MAGENAARRGRLFDLYVNQPGHQDLTQGTFFWCPLCRRAFNRDATSGDNPRLTLAHIIPESLDGTWATLACAECNNGNGHAIETDLLTSHKLADWAKGHNPVNVRLGEGNRVKAELRRDPKTNRLDIKNTTPMVSPAVPAFRDRMTELLKNPGEGAGFQLKLPWFRSGWCKAAVCQSAYLLMFKYFGYDFARNPAYNFIRRQVLRPDDEHESVIILELPPDVAEQFLEGKQAAVIIVRDPTRAVLSVMRFRSPGNHDQVLAVAMPGPDEPSLTTLNLAGAVYSPVTDDPEDMSRQQGSFWLAWHRWINS